MSTLYYERTPFDILFRNFFNAESNFTPCTFDNKQPHPLDIYYDEDGLNFEIACTGLTKKDIQLKIDGDQLNISYDKPSEEESYDGYIYKGLAKRSFKLGYKIAAKFDLSKIEAKMENGLLHLFIPTAEDKKSKIVTIK